MQGEYLDTRNLQEALIEEVRREEVEDVTWRQPASGSKHGNTSNSRSGRTTHVRMKRNEIFLYHTKAPFVPSGKSIRGALEYDPAADTLKCHECGEWEASLPNHIKTEHGLTARKYKKRHFLAAKTALVSEATRIAMVKSYALSPKRKICLEKLKAARVYGVAHAAAYRQKNAPMWAESLNARNHCPAQLIEYYRNIAEIVGHTPTAYELDEHKAGLSSVLQYHFSIAAA
jgi:predicted transcriptional regulator